MRHFSKNEKMMGTAVLVLGIIFLSNILVVKPLGEKFKSSLTDISRYQLLVRKYTELEQNQEYLLSEYKKIEKFLALKGSDNEKMSAVLSRIESEARKANLTIVDMKPEASPKSKSGFIVYRIQMNAEGTTAKVISFLYGLENADILFNVEKMNLSLKNESTGLMKFEIIILGVSVS